MIWYFYVAKESSSKEPENEEQVLQESPEENISYEVDEPIILLDPRGNIYLFVLNNEIDILDLPIFY